MEEKIKNKIRESANFLEKILDSKNLEIEIVCYNFEENVKIKIINGEIMFESLVEYDISDREIIHAFWTGNIEFEISSINNIPNPYIPNVVLEMTEDYVYNILKKNAFKNSNENLKKLKKFYIAKKQYYENKIKELYKK